MSHSKNLYLTLCGMILAAGCAAAQPAARPGYDVNYIGPPMADPVLQHSKETYVLFGCSYCHGLYLVARGEATDLMHSRLVGRDENGNVIGPLLRSGIPQTAKLSPMPQFSDLSDQQIADLVRWIHYGRQQGRYKELIQAKLGSGDAAAGKAYFEQSCMSCHSAESVAKKGHDAAALRAQILSPKGLDAAPSWKLERLNDAKTIAARQRHQKMLENYSTDDVANLVAYLQSVK
ncbi:MAG: cytochrome c [Acidobacteriota bacterium]